MSGYAARALAITFLAIVVSTSIVHARAGNEIFLCADGRCELGSGASWALTGVTVAGPILAVAGFTWSRSLHQRDRLGPFSYRQIPDGEEILEGLGVIVAGLGSWWLIRNGSQSVALEVGFPNDMLTDRLGVDEAGRPLVPARRTWFLVGALLGAPFAFSLGSMIGREWFGRQRRRAYDADALESESSEVEYSDDPGSDTDEP